MDSWAIPTLSVTEHEQLLKCFVDYILHNPQISYYHSHHTHNNRILFAIMDVIKKVHIPWNYLVLDLDNDYGSLVL